MGQVKIIAVNSFFYFDHAAAGQLLFDLSFHLVKIQLLAHVMTS